MAANSSPGLATSRPSVGCSVAPQVCAYRPARRRQLCAGRRRRIVELVVTAEPERERRLRPAVRDVLIVGLSAVRREGEHAPHAADGLDHLAVLEEVGAVYVVALAQEHVEAEPLVDPEVSRETLAAQHLAVGHCDA